MYRNDADDDRVYLVAVNHEEQHALWPAERPLPDGWRPEGFTGGRRECLTHVARVWTDLRPLSLRAHDGR